MKRAALLAIVVGACGFRDGRRPDAAVEGSGSAVAFVMEPSPQDFHLEVVVALASMVVMIGPVRARRRRRRDLAEL